MSDKLATVEDILRITGMLMSDNDVNFTCEKHITEAYMIVEFNIVCSCGKKGCKGESREVYKVPLSYVNQNINMN